MSQEATTDLEALNETAVIDAPPPTPAPKAETVDRYELRKQISKGGFAAVFEAYDPRIKRAVAVKKCSSLDEESHERFFREAEIAGNLSHPHIVRIFDFGVADGVPFIVQELLGGRDLTDWIESGLELSTHHRVKILRQIAEGVAYAHSRDVVHRDIKPGNVRVLEDLSIKLLDFGVATLQATPSDLTETGTTVGTAAYLAPEQIEGTSPSRATDVFSFGVLAYELLSGHRPFEAETLSGVLYQIAHSRPEELRAGAIPRRLAELVHRCLEKNPAARPANFDEIVAAIDRELRDPRLAPPSAETVPIPIYPGGVPENFNPAGTGSKATPEASSPRAGPPTPPVRDSSTRIQVAKPRRRMRPPLIALLLPLLAAGAWAVADAPLPEPLERAIADAKTLLGAAAPGATPTPVPPEGKRSERVAAPPPALSEDDGLDPVTATIAALEEARGSSGKAPASPVPAVVERRTATTGARATLFLPPSWDTRVEASVDGGAFQSLDRRRTHSLSAGDHRITFRLNTGSYRAERSLELTLDPAETRTLASPLAPPAALSVAVLSEPREGTLEIDGRRHALPLREALVLEPGSHRATFHPAIGDPLGPLSKTIELIPQTNHELTFDMRRRRASVAASGPFDWAG